MKAETPVRPGRLGLCVAVLGAGLFWTAGGGETPAMWPRHFDTPQGRCTVFEPQPAALRGERLEARAALAVTPADSTNVVFGIADLEARVTQDLDRRQATVAEMVVAKTTFVPADSAAMSGLAEALKPELAKLTWSLSSEALDLRLEAVAREREATRDVKTAPPRIVYHSVPTALIVLDGPPQLRALTNSPLMRVVNTPYAMLFHAGTKTYWLQGADTWFSAADWRGEWSPVAQPPVEVVAAVPKATAASRPLPGAPGALPPRIVVSSEPTELIVTRGEPTYTPVEGNELLYVSNSDQLVFLEIASQRYYVVFSGRWYRSTSLSGPWDAVASDQLSAAFARIPPGSPKSEALTYVAGTTEAGEAVARASIPQITAVDRGVTNLEVQYDGAPQFQPVASTDVQSATNTADAVFLVRGAYYLCRDAVWYTGPGPSGPWSVATTVPVEIQSLPPSHPHYNVKYVYVYGSTPEVVYAGYEPGYAGCYVAGPTIVYGTGWWYPGWYGPSCYWAYPATFGFGFGYNSWSGWSVGVGFGYGWLSCGYGWGWGGYYPVGWWGPCGAYWACAPSYPCYAGYPHHGYPHHPESGHPPPYDSPGGKPPGPPPSGASAMRSDPRKDAPTPYDRPSNPQRRTLPEYGRTAKAPYQTPTTLNSPRRADAKSGGAATPATRSAPARASVPTRTPASPQGQVARAGGSMPAPVRSGPGAVAGTTSSPTRGMANAQPSRSMQGSTTAAPMRSGSASAPSAPGRQSVPTRTSPSAFAGQPGSGAPARSSAGATFSPSARSGGAPVRSPSYTMAPSTAAPSRAASAYSPGAWSGRSSYGGFSGAPPARSAAPSFSAPVRSGGYGSGFSAPTRSGGMSSGFSAPTRSAPMSAPSGSSGGGMGRGGVSRGR